MDAAAGGVHDPVVAQVGDDLRRHRLTTPRRRRRGAELTAVIRNQGPVVAAMVRISLLEDPHGRRVLPTLYSDNHLWLLPGESRTVRLSWPTGAC
ncbi:hypothetical protein C3488_07095 [Streptomyces sp. Ru72]|nr:glycoside hydrolase family 2 protein [Streptomyces sp. Ru72]POX52800.1 hypothetical protein C3488_07095 [Streptomyces sp. Ru72]